MSTSKLDKLATEAREKTFHASDHADNAIALAIHRMLHDEILWTGVIAIYKENNGLFQRAFRQYLKDYIQLQPSP